jgi:hypothetical protein
MTVTVTSLGGPNSQKIAYDAGTLLGDIVNAADAFLISHGWDLWDAAAGANARCYRALCLGGTPGTLAHYKYAVLDYNTAGYLIVRCYESWDNIAHSGVNKATNSYDLSYGNVGETALAQRIDLAAGGDLRLFANNRYLVIRSQLASGSVGDSTYNGAAGVFERARDNLSDTYARGVPPVVYANIAMALNWTSGTAFNRASVPRAFDGATGAGSYAGGYAVIGLPEFCTARVIQPLGPPYTTRIHLQNSVEGAYLCASLKMMIDGDGVLFADMGRLFGIVALGPGVGSEGDTATIGRDADGLYNPRGTPTDHYVLACGTPTNAVRALLPL